MHRYTITVNAFREDWPVRTFHSDEKPTVCTIDGASGTPVALEIVSDNLELILPLGTVIEVNESTV